MTLSFVIENLYKNVFCRRDVTKREKIYFKKLKIIYTENILSSLFVDSLVSRSSNAHSTDYDLSYI